MLYSLASSQGSKLCLTLLNITKHSEMMTKIQFTRTATQLHWNQIFRQFNNDQCCMWGLHSSHGGSGGLRQNIYFFKCCIL